MSERTRLAASRRSTVSRHAKGYARTKTGYGRRVDELCQNSEQGKTRYEVTKNCSQMQVTADARGIGRKDRVRKPWYATDYTL